MTGRWGARSLAGALVLAAVVVLPVPTAAVTPSPPEAVSRPAIAASSAGLEQLLGGETDPAAAAAATNRHIKFVRSRRCPGGSIFTCITLRVPRDQLGSAGGRFEITFAIHRAKPGKRIGTFVTVTGGPGSSGISVADWYTSGFDPRIVRRYDIVFFDQRGVGLSEPLQCPDAALEFYTSPHVPTISSAEALAFAADSHAFADACIDETGVNPADLPYFSTRQAVEDLDDIRAWLGVPKLDLYGESYGTQYAQTYAAAHPRHVRSLMLDGPVDLTLGGLTYYAEGVRAFESVLVRTLNACTDTRGCRRDVSGRDPLAGYDALAAQLRSSGPIDYDFVLADGSTEVRSFGLGDLETAAAGYVYGEFDRMTLQRAIAWAIRGELLPLARLAAISLGQDAETLEVIPDPSWSDAMYYAVECMDYAYGHGTADQRAARFLARGVEEEVDGIRLGSVFYGDLPCPYWPVHPPNGRPGYLTSEPFPTFVLASTWDPATPFAGAKRIYRHLADGYLIIQPGGPHVIFGRGNACPDELITRFLLKGQRPAARKTRCEFSGVEPYVRIPAPTTAGYPGPKAAMGAIDNELNYSADYWAWDGVDDLRYGCLFGGWLRYRPYDDGYKVKLKDCELSVGLPLTGKARIDTTNETFDLTVTGPGTSLHYHRAANGHRTVTGTYLGAPVS